MVMITKSGISPQETRITGRWIDRNGYMIADGNYLRIEYLTHHVLKGIEISDDGWDLLYQDRSDGRYWELTYEPAGMPGTGKPTLAVIDPELARKKYRLR